MSETGNFRDQGRGSKCGEDCGTCARQTSCAFALDFLTLEVADRAAVERGAAAGAGR